MSFGDLLGTLTGNAASITNPTDATNAGIAVSVGDLIFGVVGEQTTLTNTGCTDNLGNTYTAQNAGTDAGTSTGRAWYTRVTVAGTLTAVHFAATASTDNVAVFACAFKGPFVVTPIDGNPANITSDITSPFTCPATGALAQARELVVNWAVATGSTVWAATSPCILAGQAVTAAILHTVIGYQVVNSTTTVSSNFTAASNPTDAVLGTASFKQQLTTRLGGKGHDVGLVGHWPLNEGSGLKTRDISGNVNTGTLTNSPTWVHSERFGNAIKTVNASFQYVDCGDIQDANFVSTDSFSILIWYKGDTAQFTAHQDTGTLGVAGTLLTVSAISAGTILGVGMAVETTANASLTEITALGTGAGGVGTYTVNTTANVPSTNWLGAANGYQQFNPVCSKLLTSGNFTGWTIYLDYGTNPRGLGAFKIVDIAGNNALATTPVMPYITTGVWHLFAGVVDRTAQLVKMSFDGLPFSTASCSSVGSLQNTATVQVANQNGQAGTFHDFRIYKRALTIGEIGAVYNGQRYKATSQKRNFMLWSQGPPGTILNSDFFVPSNNRLTLNADLDEPLGDHLNLSSDRNEPFMDRFALNADFDDPIMAKIAVPSADTDAPVMARSSLSSDADAPIIDSLTLNKDTNEPVMAKIAVPSADTDAPLMTRASITNDADAPVMARSSLSSDTDAPIIDRLNLTSDSNEPAMTRMALSSDADAPVMARASITSDADTPLLEGLVLIKDSNEPIMAKIAVPTPDFDAPVMSRLALSADENFPYQDRLALNSDADAPIMGRSTTAADLDTPMMTGASLTSDADAPIITTLLVTGPVRDSILPLMSALLLNSDSMTPMLSQALLVGDTGVPIRTTIQVVTDSIAAMMSRLALINDFVDPLMSKISLATMDWITPLASYASRTNDYDAPLMTALKLASDMIVPNASQLSLTGDWQPPIMSRITVPVRDSAIPVASFLQAISDSSVPLADMIQTQADYTLRAMSRLALVMDSNDPLLAVLSISASLSTDSGLPLGTMLNLQPDMILPLRSRISVTTDRNTPFLDKLAVPLTGGDTSIPFRARTQVFGDRVFPIFSHGILNARGPSLLSTRLNLAAPRPMRIIDALNITIDRFMPMGVQLGIARLVDAALPILTSLNLDVHRFMRAATKLQVWYAGYPYSAYGFSGGAFGWNAVPILPLATIQGIIISQNIIPIAATVTSSSDLLLPATSALKLNAQQDLTISAASSILADLLAPLQTGQSVTLTADRLLPLLSGLGVSITADHALPLLYRLLASADVSMPLKANLILAPHQTLPMRDALSLNADRTGPMLTKQSRVGDVTAPMFDRLALQGIERLSFGTSFQLLLTAIAKLPLASSMVLNSDGKFPSLIKQSQQSDALLRALTRLSLQGDTVIPMATALRMARDIVSSLLSRVTVTADEKLPQVWKSTLVTDAIAEIMTHLGLSQIPNIPIMTTLKLVAIELDRIMTQLDVTSDRVSSIGTHVQAAFDTSVPASTSVKRITEMTLPMMTTRALTVERYLAIQDKLTVMIDEHTPVGDAMLIIGDIHAALATGQAVVTHSDSWLPILARFAILMDAKSPLSTRLGMNSEEILRVCDHLRLSGDIDMPVNAVLGIVRDLSGGDMGLPVLLSEALLPGGTLIAAPKLTRMITGPKIIDDLAEPDLTRIQRDTKKLR